MPGKPYDGHTLPEALAQASILSDADIRTTINLCRLADKAWDAKPLSGAVSAS